MLYTVSDEFALTGKLKLITRAIPRVGRVINHRRCRKCVILLYLTVLGTRRHVTRYPKQHGRHIGIFQTDTTAFLESRGLGLISVIVRISFLFILLFTILNSSFSSLSFVQLSVASLLIVMCMVLIVRYFINVSTKIW